jgi:outer membrane protein assembly factor BamD
LRQPLLSAEGSEPGWREAAASDTGATPPCPASRHLSARARGVASLRGRATPRAALGWALIALLLTTAGCGPKIAKKMPSPPKNQPAGSSTSNQELYDQAVQMIAERKFEKARDFLSRIGTREAVEIGLDPLVKLAIADSYFYQPGIENVIEAEARYTQFVNTYPTHQQAGYAQFQLGICNLLQSPSSYLDQTYTSRAIDEFNKVQAVDPTSRFVRPADQMRERAQSKIAMHYYEVGVYYFKHKAWLGAVGRFKGLLEGFPQFRQSDGAYYYLGVALIRWGSDAEGRIYLQKLIKDYPDSRFAKKAAEYVAKDKL